MLLVTDKDAIIDFQRLIDLLKGIHLIGLLGLALCYCVQNRHADKFDSRCSKFLHGLIIKIPILAKMSQNIIL